MPEIKKGSHDEVNKQFKLGNQENKVQQSIMGFESLERMIDEFNKLYSNSKNELITNISAVEGLSERKHMLDDFFGRIESESNKIKNSQVYRAFKNLYLSGNDIQKLRVE